MARSNARMILVSRPARTAFARTYHWSGSLQAAQISVSSSSSSHRGSLQGPSRRKSDHREATVPGSLNQSTGGSNHNPVPLLNIHRTRWTGKSDAAAESIVERRSRQGCTWSACTAIQSRSLPCASNATDIDAASRYVQTVIRGWEGSSASAGPGPTASRSIAASFSTQCRSPECRETPVSRD